jgi:ferulate-5-hydroxylase
MEWLQDPLSWVLVASLAIVLLQLRRRGKAPLPPGLKPLPIIGNMTMMDQLTHRGLAALAEQYGGLLHACTSSWAGCTRSRCRRPGTRARCRTARSRTAPPPWPSRTLLTYDRADMAFAHYGTFWRQMRKLCAMKLFSRRRAETWVAVHDESAP